MNCPSLNKDKRGGLAFRRIFMTNDKLKSCSLSRLDHQIDQQNNILSIDLQLYFLKLTMMTRTFGTFTYRFFTHRSELEMHLGGIQSEAKNQFLVLRGACHHES